MERLQLQSRVWEPSGRQLLTKIGDGSGLRALDVGCGARVAADPRRGRLLRQVVGADIDERLLDAARSLLHEEKITNVELVVDDLFNSKLDPESFDLVHARYVTLPWPRLRAGAAHRRLVRPGGSLVLEEWDLGSWHFNPPAPAAERLIRLLSEVFAALGGEAGRGLPGPAQRNRHRGARAEAHVVASNQATSYRRLPLHFSVALESRLNEMIGADDLAALRSEAECELAEPGRWGTTFTLIQCWGTTLTEEAMDLDELVFHPWTVQGPRDVLTLVGGAGSHVIDADGRRYLDFSSQLVFTNLGHQHPRIVAAIKQQADQLCTLAPGHASDVRGEAARMIVEVAPDGLGHVLFTTGGTEAIEHAVRMARVPTGDRRCSRRTARTTARRPHRSTSRATRAAGPRTPARRRGPLLRALPVSLGVRIDHARGRVRARARTSRAGDPSRGPSTIAALVLESVTGGSGVIVPPTGYLRGVRDLCTRHGIVYIADEVLVGFGRTGAWFAIDHDGVAPRPHGFRERRQPVRAARRRIGRRFGVRDLHPTSVSGGPDLQRAPARMCSRCRRDPSHARRGHCRGSLASRRGHPRARAREACRDPPLRGGRSWHRRTVGIELVRDRETKEPIVPVGATGEANAPMTAFAKACLGRGLIPLILGNRVHVAPPLNVSDSDASTGLAILDEALAAVDTFRN